MLSGLEQFDNGVYNEKRERKNGVLTHVAETPCKRHHDETPSIHSLSWRKTQKKKKKKKECRNNVSDRAIVQMCYLALGSLKR